MMSTGAEQWRDIGRNIKHGGVIGKLAAVFMFFGVLFLLGGFSCMIYGYVTTRQSLDIIYHGHEEAVPERLRHEGFGPFWVVGLVSCGAGATFVGLSMSLCLCLCCFNSGSRGAKDMRKGKKQDEDPEMSKSEEAAEEKVKQPYTI